MSHRRHMVLVIIAAIVVVFGYSFFINAGP
jgi:hypothetical protein